MINGTFNNFSAMSLFVNFIRGKSNQDTPKVTDKIFNFKVNDTLVVIARRVFSDKTWQKYYLIDLKMSYDLSGALIFGYI
jgi:hypothetical protein